jgi:methylenetetrahydrofolate dehydrogenase (NADP+) / methenyltetrahydrofolate cyclohydrolase
MAAVVIDGKALAATVRERVAAGVADFKASHAGEVPGLATVLAGDDPASEVYVSSKRRLTEEAGMRSIHHQLGPQAAPQELLDLVGALNADDEVDGILVQLPLPDQHDQDAVIELINPAKDVDGLTAGSAGRLAQGRPGLVPCTPRGIMEILDAAGTQPAGSSAAVLGRSILVGRPVAALLTNADATVTVCHSRTPDLAAITSRADILVAAVGRPRMVTAEMVKPGATVIDVGVNRTDAGLVGDVDYEPVAAVAGAITPVPGGVGPMTVAMLLENTLLAATARRAG